MFASSAVYPARRGRISGCAKRLLIINAIAVPPEILTIRFAHRQDKMRIT